MAIKVGVDIGSYALKAVVIDTNGNHSKLIQAGSIFNPTGQFLPNDDNQFRQLTASLKELAEAYKLKGKPVGTSLPESQAFTNIISIPYLSEAELASSIHWEAEQHIPVPLNEVHLEYEVLYKPKKGTVGEKMQVLLVAAKKSVIERAMTLFGDAGLDLTHLETGLLSAYRSLSPILNPHAGTIILNLGAISTDILIIDQGKLALSYTVQTGGSVFTRAIQQSLGLTSQQAEEYKRTYGLINHQLEGKVRQALEPVTQIIGNEIRKAVQYYQSSANVSGIQTIVLCGGGSYLPDIIPYLTQILSAEVIITNPFSALTVSKDLTLPKDAASYAVAVGLALHHED